MTKKVFFLLSFITMIASSTQVHASYAGRVELGIHAGGAFFEGSTNINDAEILGGRLGYNLTDRVAFEGSIFSGSSDIENTNVDADLLFYGGEFLFHANRETMRPFFALGGGIIDVDRDDNVDMSDGQFQWGGGVKFPFKERFNFRLDARHLLNVDDGEGPSAFLLTAGLSAFFGGDREDSDGDGVYDSKDECPETPRGAKVNKKGCPLDTDGDGVYDYEDDCPQTPKGVQVDSTGCSDSDGDGVPNTEDACPDTPEGLSVDDEGCSDRDGDGFRDDRDDCPNEPETENDYEDDDGCPDKKPLPKKAWILERVEFISGSTKFTSGSQPFLKEALDILRDNPSVRVEIQGHTDSIGKNSFNQRLSLLRAEAVKDYLIQGGVDKSRLEVKGYGETKPISTNKTKQGRARNRRIEFKVLSR